MCIRLSRKPEKEHMSSFCTTRRLKNGEAGPEFLHPCPYPAPKTPLPAGVASPGSAEPCPCGQSQKTAEVTDGPTPEAGSKQQNQTEPGAH